MNNFQSNTKENIYEYNRIKKGEIDKERKTK
jgi:hypothetical protein|nr:MAG TPA: hypothetical protein [Caudoviricetes sp.]